MPGQGSWDIGVPIINTIGNIGMQAQQNTINAHEADKAFARNWAMTEWMLNYNHPKNQMARYREAGLNPNLIYGQGNPGNATKMPEYMAPEYRLSMPDMMGMLTQYQNAKLLQAQTENERADTQLKYGQKTILNIDEKLKTIEHGLKLDEDAWRSETVYNPYQKHKTSRYQLNLDRKAYLEDLKERILEQNIEQNSKFMETMDLEKYTGIVKEGMQVLQMLFNMYNQTKK